MAAFDYRQAEEIRDALARHAVRYLFIGKAGAVLLGFPDILSPARRPPIAQRIANPFPAAERSRP